MECNFLHSQHPDVVVIPIAPVASDPLDHLIARSSFPTQKRYIFSITHKRLHINGSCYLQFSQVSIKRNTTLDKDFLDLISNIPSSRGSG